MNQPAYHMRPVDRLAMQLYQEHISQDIIALTSADHLALFVAGGRPSLMVPLQGGKPGASALGGTPLASARFSDTCTNVRAVVYFIL